MGQSKLRKNVARNHLYGDLRACLIPPSAEELALRAIIPTLEHVSARTVEAYQEGFEAMTCFGFEANDCHANCYRLSVRDPEFKWILGWMESKDGWTLHSIIECQGKYACITPMKYSIHEDISFFIDPALEYVEGIGIIRDGKCVEAKIVRSDPDSLYARAQLGIDALDRGASPEEAVHVATYGKT